jgi:hypothetical protein
MQLSETNRNVFINCPFDADYRACFEALLFTVMVSGYRVRCALEDDDAANIRFDKLRRLIRESPRTIHDLSRTELGENELPRFNMPFELGLAMGAKHFGGPKRRKNTALIMVRERYALPAYLSDLGGNDPTAHGGDPHNIMRIVSRYLHATPAGRLLPGPQSYVAGFRKFKEDFPGIAAGLDWHAAKIDPFANYRVYLLFLAEFVRTANRVSAD